MTPNQSETSRRGWLSPFVYLSNNWVSLAGVVIVTTTVVFWLFLLPPPLPLPPALFRQLPPISAFRRLHRATVPGRIHESLGIVRRPQRSEEHTSELQSLRHLV